MADEHTGDRKHAKRAGMVRIDAYLTGFARAYAIRGDRVAALPA